MSSDVFFLVIQFVVLLLSLSIHESAHAWTADALGDPTARYLGRVSLIQILYADAGSVLSRVAYGQIVEGSPVLAPLIAFAYHGIVINLILAVFNFIPIAPLDGAAVVSGLLPRSMSVAFDQMQSYGFILLIGLLYLGIPAMLYTPVINFVLSFLFV